MNSSALSENVTRFCTLTVGLLPSIEPALDRTTLIIYAWLASFFMSELIDVGAPSPVGTSSPLVVIVTLMLVDDEAMFSSFLMEEVTSSICLPAVLGKLSGTLVDKSDVIFIGLCWSLIGLC